MPKKIIIAVLLCITLILGLIPVQAYSNTLSEDVQIIASLGMLKGDGKGITEEYVQTTPTRLQAAIMFLRLKGLESDALKFRGIANFSDANDISWSGGKAIMAYLKAHPELGWQGDGINFYPLNNISSKEYYKVMLETLGYRQTKEGALGDFTWSNALDFAHNLGMGKSAYVNYFVISELATVTVEALKAKIKDEDKSLINKLVDDGIVSSEKLSLLSSNLTSVSILSGLVTSETTIVVNLQENVSAKLASDISQYKVTIDNTKINISSVRYDEKTKKAVLIVDLKGKTGVVKVNGVIANSIINLSSLKLVSVSGIDSSTYVFYAKLSDYPIETITGKKLILQKDSLQINATCVGVNGTEAIFEVDRTERTRLQNGIYIIKTPSEDSWLTVSNNIIIYPALSISSVSSISSADAIFTVTLSEYPISSLTGKKLILVRDKVNISATYLNISNLKAYFSIDANDKSKLSDGIYIVTTPENDRWAFISGKTTNYLTASSYISVSYASYDVNTGKLGLSGNGFRGVPGAFNDISSNKISISNGSEAYTLKSTPNVEITNNYFAELTLSSEDRTNVNALLTLNGSDNGLSAAYNLSLEDGWNGDGASADLANHIYVSGYPSATITSATYNCSTGVMVITGTEMKKAMGENNDVVSSMLTIYTPNGRSYTLATTSGAEITEETSVTITVTGRDRAELNDIFDKNGFQNNNGQPYYLRANAGWNGSGSTAETTLNPINVSGCTAPEITGAVYNYSTGILTLTGSGFRAIAGASNDINAQKIVISAHGGSSYTISSNTASVEAADASTANIILGSIDRMYINEILNKDGAQSADNLIYNIAVMSGWNGSAAAEDSTDNIVTVTGHISPYITGAAYNFATGQLTITGSNLKPISGTNNDITVDKIIISAGSKSYTLTAETSNCDITSTTTAVVQVSGRDRAELNNIFDKNGTSDLTNNPYNIGVAANWNGLGSTADLTGNSITVSNYSAPIISNASYDFATGILTLTGSYFRIIPGANNDIDATKFTISDGTKTYSLTSATSNAEVLSSTSAVIQVNGIDRLNLNWIFLANGLNNGAGGIYNIAAAVDWNGAGAPADLINSILVSNWAAPGIANAAYDRNTNVLTLICTNLRLSGGVSSIDVTALTISDGVESYRLTDANSTLNIASHIITITISIVDQAGVQNVLTTAGVESAPGRTYNLSSEVNWNLSGSPADLTNSITVIE